MGSVAQIVADPDFGKLSAEDQRGVLAHFDSDFSKVSAGELPAVIQGIQKNAMARPDLAAPPGVPRPRVNMQTAGLGTDTSTVPNPKTAIAMSGNDPSGFTGEAIAGLTAVGTAGTALGAAGGTAAGAATLRALAPIAKKYGIKALEGAGLGAGYDLYKALKKVYEGE